MKIAKLPWRMYKAIMDPYKVKMYLFKVKNAVYLK